MSDKIYIPEGGMPPASQIGATLEALGATIAQRRDAGEGSYTFRLLAGREDFLLKKVAEEACEVALAAKDGEADHLRYEAADLVYHLLVVLERYGISLDEFAAELNTRMADRERPQGGVRLHDEFVQRGNQ